MADELNMIWAYKIIGFKEIVVFWIIEEEAWYFQESVIQIFTAIFMFIFFVYVFILKINLFRYLINIIPHFFYYIVEFFTVWLLNSYTFNYYKKQYNFQKKHQQILSSAIYYPMFIQLNVFKPMLYPYFLRYVRMSRLEIFIPLYKINKYFQNKFSFQLYGLLKFPRIWTNVLGRPMVLTNYHKPYNISLTAFLIKARKYSTLFSWLGFEPFLSSGFNKHYIKRFFLLAFCRLLVKKPKETISMADDYDEEQFTFDGFIQLHAYQKTVSTVKAHRKLRKKYQKVDEKIYAFTVTQIKQIYRKNKYIRKIILNQFKIGFYINNYIKIKKLYLEYNTIKKTLMILKKSDVNKQRIYMNAKYKLNRSLNDQYKANILYLNYLQKKLENIDDNIKALKKKI